ncbi:ferrochelatase [Modestobacter versicolor]|uniref:Coproporphyrin III ferrochelatase n=1 Tax=Modestobacter versicolor TaxID=429133 RepID=A0A323VE39_9ACTN|nr:ferrochelatase [Modestobacter versicolor]MBB3674878.1 ferrochelatase [Modestobacter versicolor]PZA22915.1 ferrochelatase [Modestobacter versicolor]
MTDLARPRHPLPAGASITPPGQQPNEDPSLAVRNNGGVAPSASPAPAGRREALLVLGFGGPEGTDDVMPFLENVTRGRGIPPERLLDVAEHYHHFGGVSPINEQNKALVAALEGELAAAGIDVPVYWGNRNWAPYVEDAWRQMAEDGIEHAYVLATSAYASFSGCRQYHEDVARARVALESDPAAPAGPTAEKLPHYFDAPGFVQANADALAAALAELPAELRDTARLVATAHSIPNAMAAVAGPQGGAYEAELTRAAQLAVDAAAPGRPFDLVWQSRSGPPSVPWLEPDVNDHLRALAEQGEKAVVVFPVGFISDHLEVIWDLDNEAEETAGELGLAFVRAGTAGTHPAFVASLRQLLEERRAGGEPRLGTNCPAHCCFVQRPARPGAPAA